MIIVSNVKQLYTIAVTPIIPIRIHESMSTRFMGPASFYHKTAHRESTPICGAADEYPFLRA